MVSSLSGKRNRPRKDRNSKRQLRARFQLSNTIWKWPRNCKNYVNLIILPESLFGSLRPDSTKTDWSNKAARLWSSTGGFVNEEIDFTVLRSAEMKIFHPPGKETWRPLLFESWTSSLAASIGRSGVWRTKLAATLPH